MVPGSLYCGGSVFPPAVGPLHSGPVDVPGFMLKFALQAPGTTFYASALLNY